MKEQLHHIPANYTARAGADEKTPATECSGMVGWGVAARLLGILVMATWAKPVASGRAPASPARQGTIPWLSQVVDFSPPPRVTPAVLGEGLDEDAHGWPKLEPALEAVISFRQEWRHDLPRIRAEVLRELQEMVEEAAEDTKAWLDALPSHVRATYETGDRPRPFQGPVFDRLLRGLGYPASDDLRQDVNEGFDMLGRVRAAPGWKPRSDGRYSHPEGLERLHRENPQYVARKSARPRDQEHTQALLDELVEETRLGRVTGPCAAPRHWSVTTTALPSVAGMGSLRQPPAGDCFAALSFAICQVDEHGDLKLRRGEDWRRSGHNATMGAEDVPTHHFLGDIVDLILRAWAEGWDPVVFGHDLQNAYRQWAVRHPGHCGAFLPTSSGVTLWFHFAMCFGAAASVWNFNRAADAVQMLLRALLLVLLGHFVGVDSGFLRPPRAPDQALQGTGPGRAARGAGGRSHHSPGGRGTGAHDQAYAEDLGADRRGADGRLPVAGRCLPLGGAPHLLVPVHLRSDGPGGYQAALFQGGGHGRELRRHTVGGPPVCPSGCGAWWLLRARAWCPGRGVSGAPSRYSMLTPSSSTGTCARSLDTSGPGRPSLGRPGGRMAGGLFWSSTATSSTTSGSSSRSTSPRSPPGRPSSTSWRSSRRSFLWSPSPGASALSGSRSSTTSLGSSR